MELRQLVSAAAGDGNGDGDWQAPRLVHLLLTAVPLGVGEFARPPAPPRSKTSTTYLPLEPRQLRLSLLNHIADVARQWPSPIDRSTHGGHNVRVHDVWRFLNSGFTGSCSRTGSFPRYGRGLGARVKVLACSTEGG